MAKNELLPFADGEDANVLPTNQWEALTDILENGFQSGIAKSEQVNRVLAQGAVASYVLGQLIVDQLNKDATLDKDTLYQNIVKALQENAKDACLPLSGGTLTGDLRFSGGVINRTDNLSGLTIFGGTVDGSAYLQAFGKDANGNNGRFNLVASNGSVATSLMGQPEGVLSWGSEWVECVSGSGGNYVRLRSGWQICWGDTSTASNNIANISFAVPFNQLPAITANVIGDTPNDFSVVIRTRDGQGFTALANFNNVSRPGVGFCWIAIGRWK